MALIEFENNTAPYLNADNLNNNFNYLEEKNNYSTEEVVIGKWVDEKPIYRKIVNLTSVAGYNSFPISQISSDIDKIIKFQTILTQENGNQMNVPYRLSDTDFVHIYYSVPNNAIIIRTGDLGYGNNLIIMEFTKTTD